MSEQTRRWLCVLVGAVIGIIFTALMLAGAHARDLDLSSVRLRQGFGGQVTLVKDDGRFAGSPLKPWFDKLASGKGLCCSFADGVKVEDVDWDVQDGHYRVRLNGQWIAVPDNALVTEPNKFGPAVVWPYQDATGATQIRCFIPGSGA